MHQLRLINKVALVTGAARGIGRATAVRFAQEGASLALLDIAAPVEGAGDLRPASQNDLFETQKAIEALEKRTLPLVADIRSFEAMEQAVISTVETFGKLDIVVANAGIASWSPLSEMTPEQWQVVLDVNLTGVFNIIRAVIPHMIERQQGRIIAVSSIGGRAGAAGVANYAASKWGIIGLVKTAALELGTHNITVNAVAPTAVNTPMYRSPGQAKSTNPGKPNPDAMDQDVQMLAYHPMPIAALSPEDIADGITFLASDEAKYISGVTLDIAAGGNARYTG